MLGSLTPILTSAGSERAPLFSVEIRPETRSTSCAGVLDGSVLRTSSSSCCCREPWWGCSMEAPLDVSEGMS